MAGLSEVSNDLAQERLRDFYEHPCASTMTFADVANATLGNVHTPTDLQAIADDLHKSLPENVQNYVNTNNLTALLNQNAHAGAGAAVCYKTDEGDVFLRAQSSRSVRNYVMTQGGACESGESFRETALREAIEELGNPPVNGKVLEPLYEKHSPESLTANIDFTPCGIAQHLLDQHTKGKSPFFYAAALYKTATPVNKEQLMREIGLINSRLSDPAKIDSYRNASDMIFGAKRSAVVQGDHREDAEKEIRFLVENHPALLPPDLMRVMQTALVDGASAQDRENALEAHVSVSENQKLDVVRKDDLSAAAADPANQYFKPALKQTLVLVSQERGHDGG